MAQSTIAGYSGKPLHAKLGFKPGWRVALVDAPERYRDLLAGADEVAFLHDLRRDGRDLDAVHLFLTDPRGIAEAATAAIPHLREGGMLWVSWRKKSSKQFDGVTEDALRDAILPLGWVDVKVCAVDADWSALKFLKRKA